MASIFHATRYASIAKETGTKTDYSVAQAVLTDLEREEKQLGEALIEPAFGEESVFGRRNSLIMYIIFAALVGNFMFAVAHWFVPFVTYDFNLASHGRDLPENFITTTIITGGLPIELFGLMILLLGLGIIYLKYKKKDVNIQAINR